MFIYPPVRTGVIEIVSTKVCQHLVCAEINLPVLSAPIRVEGFQRAAFISG